jgi:hypothetical protein
MSKFNMAAIRDRSSANRPATYAVDPSRPDSSAPNQMKRTLLRGLTFVSCSAISKIVAEPDPLSLIPAPTPTESR